jgi:molybdopterin-containing oxidoreductase family iron-sulfur binding subunit
MGLEAIRARLASSGGRRYWQSLEELADTPEYRDFLHNEFPHDPANEEGIGRRDVLKYMAASAAFAGLSACTRMPSERIVPYVSAPEEIIPGKPLFYATAMPSPSGGDAIGLLVESHMGRPTKIEGNALHPGSLGATDAFAQASVLTLYDPDRSQVMIREGRVSNWTAFLNFLGRLIQDRKRLRGAGMRLLTETVISPSLGAQIRELLAAFPEARWHQWEPAGRDAAREGARMAFGRYVNTVYRLDKAEMILSLDADFLRNGPGAVRHARDFMSRRKLEGPESQMNRLYVVESTPSNTGAVADHRLPLRPAEIRRFAANVAAKLGVAQPLPIPRAVDVPDKWMEAVVHDLQRHRAASLVIAGEQQPAEVHALAHAMNAALGNAGRTVEYTDPLEVEPVNTAESLRALCEDMRDPKAVDLLFIVGANPVYSAPPDLKFAQRLMNVRTRVHMGIYADETAELCHWHIPQTHYLESWGDARAYDGTVTFVQPLIAPIYEGKSIHELLAALLGRAGHSSHDVVRSYWKAQRKDKDDKAFNTYWETSLHDGVATGTALPTKAAWIPSNRAVGGADPSLEPTGTLEAIFRPDPTIFDGRFANNGWLQELPKPFSTLTWDNAALLSVATAARLGLSNGDVVKLALSNQQVNVPVWVMPGQADDVVTLHLGYGRRRAGRVGSGQGFDAGVLRTSGSLWAASGLKVEKTGDSYPLAATQHHHILDRAGHATEEESESAFERDLVRVATLAEYRKNPGFARDPEEEKTAGLSLYPGVAYEGYSWGMAVDTHSCIGCGACVVACFSENNSPVVGKHEVLRGREMHWIRVDTYYRGDLKNPEAYYQPVFCQHCENAPCEGVCPVAATVHSPEGLNEMVYNRCVGTRYCANNCPYKVRRFNFLLFSDWSTQSLYGVRNPNVTVRSRGVMEKCTYCVQRIQAAKIEAEKQDRPLREGEVVTACQAVCPTEALVFGNINDPKSRVSRLKAQERNYSLLAKLNTRPRTTYLARVRNPNPELES